VPGGFARRPEPNSAMDTPDQVSAFDSQAVRGADGRHLLLHGRCLQPAHSPRWTAGRPRLRPGRFAAFLAGLRRDIRIVGYDLSPLMVETGNANIRAAGLADRVELRLGDMTSFADQMPRDTDLINCLFAVHHLPSLDEVRQCISQIGRAGRETGCGS